MCLKNVRHMTQFHATHTRYMVLLRDMEEMVSLHRLSSVALSLYEKLGYKRSVEDVE